MAIFDGNRRLSRKRCEIGRWLLWNVNRKSWVPDRLVSFSMTLSDPGFKVTVYLQVEYLNNGATLLDSTTHNCRPPGAIPKTCKKLGVVVENYAQEERKFSTLRTIGRYDGGRIKQRRRRSCQYDTINRFFCHYFRILPRNPHYTSSRNYLAVVTILINYRQWKTEN